MHFFLKTYLRSQMHEYSLYFVCASFFFNKECIRLFFLSFCLSFSYRRMHPFMMIIMMMMMVHHGKHVAHYGRINYWNNSFWTLFLLFLLFSFLVLELKLDMPQKVWEILCFVIFFLFWMNQKLKIKILLE